MAIIKPTHRSASCGEPLVTRSLKGCSARSGPSCSMPPRAPCPTGGAQRPLQQGQGISRSRPDPWIPGRPRMGPCGTETGEVRGVVCVDPGSRGHGVWRALRAGGQTPGGRWSYHPAIKLDPISLPSFRMTSAPNRFRRPRYAPFSGHRSPTRSRRGSWPDLNAQMA